MVSIGESMRNDHNHYMSVVEKLAISTEGVRNVRMSACVVYKNKIASFGVNKFKSHPFQLRFSKMNDCIYIHAETDAIKNAIKVLDVGELRKSTLYICRIKKISGVDVWGLAKPCVGCKRAIAVFEIKNVYYSDDNKTTKRLEN